MAGLRDEAAMSDGEHPMDNTLSDTVPPDWYAEFFTELPNEFWRRVVSAEATAMDVDFIERQLGPQRRCRILDVPCGSGRHALALAARGHAVVGVDISTEAIGHAQRAAADAAVPIELIVAELRDIPCDGSFDAAICMGNSFGYLDLAGTRAFVAALARALRPGGHLIIDRASAAESVLPGFVAGAGLSNISHCAGPLGEPFELGSGRLLLTAVRR
jgi:SAM-dependent methyltransferase